MTKFLASVTGAQEAELALAGGADIIDLKNPEDGALGALTEDGIREAVARIAGRRSVSAVCGNLAMDPETIVGKAETIAATGVDYIKIGFDTDQKTNACVRALAPLAKRSKLIAVLFADQAPDFDLLTVFAESGIHGAMVDTAEKERGRLLDHLPPERLPEFVDRARALGLMVGLGGSLEAPDVPRLLPFKPDFLGFRGALCGGAVRTHAIDIESVRRIRALIPEERAADSSTAVDYRLLAARGYSPEVADPNLGTDKIFVRDFVLPVEIGAYRFEHGRRQKVRFDVTVEVRRMTDDPQDMRHVVSYDIITDGIRSIVARGHVELAETLAEQIAAHLLTDPRVVRVSIRVEKLELGAGSVGVEIERKRAGEQSSAAPGAATDQVSGRNGNGFGR